MMASLAAYNGAILNGNFAEFDEAAQASQANAATVMRQYEDAVSALAQPWDQPLPDQVAHGAPPTAGHAAAGGATVGAAPPPLAVWRAAASINRSTMNTASGRPAPR